MLELEERARDELLEKVHLEQSELRKKDVLSAMSQLLEQELSMIQNYQDERSQNSKILLESENKTNLLLNDVFLEYDKNRADLIDKINQDEAWQKSAVAALIVKSDARSWGLMEQIKIVEQQIAAMTNYEIDKKKINQDEILNDVADKRINLTFVLLDLMEQQDKRKKQLLDTLSCMEDQKTVDDFWLMQYQKLIDTRGIIQSASASIDPELGYNFLVNGVIHVVPFLLKIWQRKDFQLENVTDDDLEIAGIKKPEDRKNVLKSIEEYLASFGEPLAKKLQEETECIPGPSHTYTPSAPQETPSPTKSASSSRDHAAINAVECVICMDAQTAVIFLPCGNFIITFFLFSLTALTNRIFCLIFFFRSHVFMHCLLNRPCRLSHVPDTNRTQNSSYSIIKMFCNYLFLNHFLYCCCMFNKKNFADLKTILLRTLIQPLNYTKYICSMLILNAF